MRRASLVVEADPELQLSLWRTSRVTSSASSASSPPSRPSTRPPSPSTEAERSVPRRRRATFHCATCGRTFRHACNLRAHEVQHARAPASSLGCPECSAAFAHADQLDDHLRQHDALRQQVQQQEQMARQMEEQQLMQLQLEEQFLIQQAYITHSNFSLGWGPPAGPTGSPLSAPTPRATPIRCVCLECGREFLQRSALRQHMKEHDAKKNGRRGKDISPRRARRQGHVANADLFFRCGCGAGFDSPQSLHAHRVVHVRKKPFHCSQCPADFSNPWNLARHYKEHLRHLCVLSLSDLRCGICNENFRSDELELRRHRALHKDLRYCRCAWCGAAFRSGWDCEQHVNTCPLSAVAAASSTQEQGAAPAA